MYRNAIYLCAYYYWSMRLSEMVEDESFHFSSYIPGDVILIMSCSYDLVQSTAL